MGLEGTRAGASRSSRAAALAFLLLPALVACSSIAQAQEAPAQGALVAETPVPETPVPETPVPETPVPETPVQETPAQDAPAQDDASRATSSADANARPSEEAMDTWHRDSETLRLDLGLSYSTFQQQVKSEVGSLSVDPLVEESSFSLALTATYGIWKYFRAGIFLQLDLGTRYAAAFGGLDAAGVPNIVGRTGGSFRELWLGPLLRFQWRGLAAEIGYGALGVRSDDARVDLPSVTGETGTFRTSPRIAWHFALSGYVPVHAHVDIVFRIQYRVRYYEMRSGDELIESVAHGTQNLTPTIGASWRL